MLKREIILQLIYQLPLQSMIILLNWKCTRSIQNRLNRTNFLMNGIQMVMQNGTLIRNLFMMVCILSGRVKSVMINRQA